ncbi:MAG: hypothetical protein IJ192_15120 [Clostridia bacterium]|nr:hypothetical protein [Clostridia bacterium]
MQKKKTTDELNKTLKNNIPIDRYLRENSESFSELSFTELLEQILKENHISKSEAIKGSDLERSYGYQIFKGTRKPTRDPLLRLCISMKASSEQTRALLLKNKAAPLYPKDKRDSIIIYGIIHKLSLSEINELLYDHKFALLCKS